MLESSGQSPLPHLEDVGSPSQPPNGATRRRSVQEAVGFARERLRNGSAAWRPSFDSQGHGKVDEGLEAALRLPCAQERLQFLVQYLVNHKLVDFACVSLVCSNSGFALGAIHGPGSEHFPPPLARPHSLGQLNGSIKQPFSLFGGRRAFCVDGSGWSVADVVASEGPWFYECTSTQNRAGQPCEAAWLYQAGMQSMVALPCIYEQRVVGCLQLAIKSKHWDECVLSKLQHMARVMTPFVAQACRDQAPAMRSELLRRFKSSSSIASGMLDEMVTLDKVLVGRIMASEAQAARAKAQQEAAHQQAALIAHAQAQARRMALQDQSDICSLPDRRPDHRLLLEPDTPVPSPASLRSTAISLPATPLHTLDGGASITGMDRESSRAQAMRRLHDHQQQQEHQIQLAEALKSIPQHHRQAPASAQAMTSHGQGAEPEQGMADDSQAEAGVERTSLLDRLQGSAAYVAAMEQPERYSQDWMSALDASGTGTQDITTQNFMTGAVPHLQMALPAQHTQLLQLDRPSTASSSTGWELESHSNVELCRQQQITSSYFASVLEGQRRSMEQQRRSSSSFAHGPPKTHATNRTSRHSYSRLSGHHDTVSDPNSLAVSLAASSSLYSTSGPANTLGCGMDGMPSGHMALSLPSLPEERN